MNAIETRHLTRRFGERIAVNDLNLTIPEGECFALLGVNGAGKTTVIRMLCGLLQPTEGDAFLLGNSIISSPEKAKSLLNLSPQETAVAPNLSARENLEFIAGIYGMSRREAKSAADEIIEAMGLHEIANRRAGKLSGGWQRRLSIAMALISRPRILFLDEPTLGLDVLARRELWRLVESLKGKMTILLTTHYLEEAEALAHRIGIMADGRLKALGTAEELKVLARADHFEEAFIALASGEEAGK